MVTYIMEDAGYPYIFHWFCFMVGTLRKIPKINVNSPIKIWFNFKDEKTVQEFHMESLRVISDEYVFEKPESSTQIIHHPHEVLLNQGDLVDSEVFVFLRNLYNSRIFSAIPTKPRFIYISRNDSATSNPANNGRVMRQIVNENEFTSDIQELGFEIIELSKVPFVEKIKLFQTASIVVSPHGSALVFSIFANPRVELIEILPENIPVHNHYKNISSALNLSYTRFSQLDIVGDRPSLCSQWNIRIHKEPFLQLLKQKIQLFSA